MNAAGREYDAGVGLSIASVSTPVLPTPDKSTVNTNSSASAKTSAMVAGDAFSCGGNKDSIAFSSLKIDGPARVQVVGGVKKVRGQEERKRHPCQCQISKRMRTCDWERCGSDPSDSHQQFHRVNSLGCGMIRDQNWIFVTSLDDAKQL